MTIIEAAMQVLKAENRPLNAEEVYDLICKRNLYSFGAKDPLSIVRAELRRYSIGFTGKTKAPSAKVKEDSSKRYTPL
jgi:restriction system protein